jgi:hypothetical protein
MSLAPIAFLAPAYTLDCHPLTYFKPLYIESYLSDAP